MRTTVIIPDELLKSAMRVTHAHTKKDAILTALRRMVRSSKAHGIKGLFGKVDVEDNLKELNALEIAEMKALYK
jgi:Arc/MetJ family transcription regulator